VVQFTDKDVEHDCNSGNETLDQEDVYLLGNTPNQFLKGITAKNFGNTSWILGARVPANLTPRGNNADIFTTRQHRHYFKVNDESEE